MMSVAMGESAGSIAEAPRKHQPRAQLDGSYKLRDPFHERFAQEVALLCEQDALGQAGEEAYVNAGFARHRRNHIRLMKQERVANRIEWLRFKREADVRAARMSPDKVIEELGKRGIDRLQELIERNAAGVVIVRDCSVGLPVEVGIAALKLMHEAFGIKMSVVG